MRGASRPFLVVTPMPAQSVHLRHFCQSPAIGVLCLLGVLVL